MQIIDFARCRRIVAVVLLFILTAVTAQAQSGGPLDVVKAATQTTVDKLNQDRDLLESDPGALLSLVNEAVVPYFDFNIISRRVLGKYWSKASEEEKTRFGKEFSQFLIRFYSNSLIAFSNPRIEYSTVAPEKSGSKVVSIKAEVTTDEVGTVPVQFGLVNVKGAWKIIDLRIDGVCLVCNYRKEYADIIRNDGLGSLIDRLTEKNAKAQVS